MSDVLVKPAFQSALPDNGSPTQLGPTAWNASRLFSGGTDGSFCQRSAAAGTGAAWSPNLSMVGPTMSIDKGGSTVSSNLLVFKTNEALAGDFSMGIFSAVNAFGSRRDQVLKWGYNFDASANARAVLTEHALVYDIENYFTPSGVTQATESHIAYINRAGTSFRPFSLYVDLTTDSINTDFVSDGFSVTSGNGTLRFLIAAGDIQLPIGSTIRKTKNNEAILRQINAAGTQNPSLIFLNNQDWLILGDGNVADILWCTPLVTVGTTTLITLGKTGGSGPAVAAQNSWMRVLDNSGAAFFVPVWK